MKRKVIYLAGSTAVLSLPSAWVKKYGVQKGDELFVEEEGNTLKVKQEGEIPSKEIEVDISSVNTSLAWYYLISAYRSGAHQIKVRYKTPLMYNPHEEKEEKVKTLLEKICGRFVGMEVIHEGESYSVLKEISKIDDREFDGILRKMQFTLLGMADEALDKESIDLKEEQMNKLSHYCIKVLNRKGRLELCESGALHTIVNNLEMMGDVYMSLARVSCGKEVRGELKELLKELQVLVESFHRAYYKPEKDVVEEFHKKRFDIKKSYRQFEKKDIYEEKIVGQVEQIRELLMETLCTRMTLLH